MTTCLPFFGQPASLFSLQNFCPFLNCNYVIIGAPLGGVAALLGAISSVLTDASKKLSFKVTKHEKILSLAICKHASIHNLVSKALNDNKITNLEFQLVNSELEQYFNLKESVRTKLRHKSTKEQTLDLNELKKKFEAKFLKSFNKRF